LLEELEEAVDGVTVIKLQSQGDRAAAAIPAEHLIEAHAQGVERLVIQSDIAEITISTTWLMALLQETEGQIELSMAKADKSKLPAHVQDQLGDHDAYELHLSINGEQPDRFSPGSVLVSIPYTLGPGEAPHRVVIYYINDEGDWEPVPNGIYDEESGMVRFAANHFSRYAAKHVDELAINIPDVAWASPALEMLAARGVINDQGHHTIQPMQLITRGEFAAMLASALGLESAAQQVGFNDVDATSPWHSAIAALESLGVVKGVGDGRFMANEPITRQDMAVLIYRLAAVLRIDLQQTRPTVSYHDEQGIAAYAYDAVELLSRAGVLNGTGDGAFQPLRKATKAEAAVIITRMLEQLH
jgi:endo-1,4-beta-xylanase